MNMKTLYLSPECEEVTSLCASVLCGSPGLGESEDIGYEDWVIQD